MQEARNLWWSPLRFEQVPESSLKGHLWRAEETTLAWTRGNHLTHLRGNFLGCKRRTITPLLLLCGNRRNNAYMVHLELALLCCHRLSNCWFPVGSIPSFCTWSQSYSSTHSTSSISSGTIKDLASSLPHLLPEAFQVSRCETFFTFPSLGAVVNPLSVYLDLEWMESKPMLLESTWWKMNSWGYVVISSSLLDTFGCGEGVWWLQGPPEG
jgi:hypothetical protein